MPDNLDNLDYFMPLFGNFPLDNRLLILNITYLGNVPVDGSKHALIKLIVAMQKANVHTIGAFMFLTLSQISSLIQLGPKTISVIFEVLQKLKDDPYLI